MTSNERLIEAAQGLAAALDRAVLGQRVAIETLIVAYMAGGHALLEGVPGLGKTLLARAFSACLGVRFSRVQFTPDLMPADVIGTNVYETASGQFRLLRGPVFTELLMADEINRTPPKTQAALLEAMQEHAVTFDGTTHPLGRNFMVVATQNPIEHQGVYPLPEAQLDRFLFKHRVTYPDLKEERAIIVHHGGGSASHNIEQYGIAAQTDRATLEAALATVGDVTLVDDVVGYIAALVRGTRESPDLEVGASPRAGAMLARAARARAALDGRNYVIPDDVKALAVPALRHRVILSPAAQIDGRLVEQIVSDLVDQTEAPR